MGRYLEEQKVRPELVLCSSAVRTQQTLERLDLPKRTRVEIEDEMYAASPDVLLERVRRVDDGVASVMVIAHNPGLHDLLAAVLEDAESIPGEFPTAALAVLRLPIEQWRELRPGIARLDRFTVPRSLD
jgi:phosphohistidine phosphatase